VVPISANYKPTVSNRWFYEGRPIDTPDDANPLKGTKKASQLATPSGKIEFVSQSLRNLIPTTMRDLRMPRYIPSWEGHQSKELTEKYPLQKSLLIPAFIPYSS
jgi:trimethylamine-N-oxide reductase (cytochrome c)